MPSQYGFGAKNANVELTLPSRQDPDDPTSPHNIVLVRRIQPDALVASGLLDSLDSLTAIVGSLMPATSPQQMLAQAKVAKAREGAARKNRAQAQPEADQPTDAETMKALAELARTGGLADVIALMDAVVEMAVVEPLVLRPIERDGSGVPIRDDKGALIPLPPAKRRADVTYTDDVGMADKSEVMNFALSGVRSIEPFRGESN